MSIRRDAAAARGDVLRDGERFWRLSVGAQLRIAQRSACVESNSGGIGGRGGTPALVMGLGGLELEPRSEAVCVKLAVFGAGENKRTDMTPPPMPLPAAKRPFPAASELPAVPFAMCFDIETTSLIREGVPREQRLIGLESSI
eukprot:7378892-Prymnesium_polylepis.1